MPLFQYTAVDAGGKPATGTLPADSRAAALEQIARQGLQPVRLEERRESAARVPVRIPLGRRRISAAGGEAFTRELANLLAAGVPLSRALHILAREAASPAARSTWTAIQEDVVGGKSLAEAMARWPQVFPPVQIAMVRAGETGGFLDVVLQQIADFRALERDLKSRVRSALTYPAVLAVLTIGVLVFLLTYFIPRFSTIFEDFGAALPKLTQAVVAVSRGVTHYGLFLLIALLLAVLVIGRGMRSDAGRRISERIVLRLPGIGRLLARFALVRFSRMLGTLVGAGVPLVTALRVAREAIGNQTLSDAVARSIEEVQHGVPLARSLAGTPQLFPASAVEVVAIAEETGRLDQELLRLAKTYEQDLDRHLRTLVSLAEPLLLFVMAGIVGTIVIGMLLPVFTLQDIVQ